ncbi:monooxygenase [Acinetobacter qingfengensis]|uniref:Monooxygenase n=1 Tax=Acinetobacter qingfengensis TaxID=1262585 RepID=A0A1E7RF39_9GAMM|nr:acyl-CoA dehydrogenase family protein [Acinetobacter qingfengensis]KAA8735697.1 monooxygenase [Acinetobacter qingfengensis]OEY97857.1 monooxygenase [Acinetobacter qingfengensis]
MSNLNITLESSELAYKSDDQATQIHQVWGEPPSSRYEALAKNFRPIFKKIKAHALQREIEHTLPIEQIQWLKDAGFTRLRLPKRYGGFEATIPEVFALLVELAEADSNLPQVLRIHFGFTEDILISQDEAFKQRWLERFEQGQTIGSAWSEGGNESIDQFQTHLFLDSEQKLRVKGKKYYTTGSLYADWTEVGITDLEGNSGSVIVSTKAEGVEIIDDWNGFGQQLTASGTAIFDDVLVDPKEVLIDDNRFKYSAAFYQLIQLAIITGIARAATYDVSQAVAHRTRNYSHANTSLVLNDPQILQIVGQVRSAAYTSGVLIEKVAQSLQRTYLAALQHNLNYEQDQNAIAELESAQAQVIITDLVLNATTILFDALGASASDKKLGLDRYWRNVRTLSSHNPRVFKQRIIGDFSVNGTLPPYQWRIGQTKQ